MLAIRLDNETEKRLNDLAQVTNRSKSYYIREAIHRFLNEQEDILIALTRIENKEGKLLSTEELWEKLGWSEKDE